MRLLGLAQVDPRVPTTGPGASSKFLFDALARRHELVARHGVDLTRAQRGLLAAVTFHPSRDKWRQRLYWKGRLALNLRSWNSRRAVGRVDEPFDLAVQVFGLFRTQGAPYALYIDNTVELSRRHWPEWVPVEGRALERLYDWERRLYGDALHVFTLGSPAARSVVDFYEVPQERVTVVGGRRQLRRPARSAGRPPRADRALRGERLAAQGRRRAGRRVPPGQIRASGRAVADRRHRGARSGRRVEVLGFLRDRDRLADLYARASVFCLPSRFEPYGLVAVEAMAHELPCVVTPGALAEVVLDGETGIVVPPEDPVALAGACRGCSTIRPTRAALASTRARGSRSSSPGMPSWSG